MAHTGERYSTARRSLIDQTATKPGRIWVAEPEFSDKALCDGTGKGWDAWCDVIEEWPGHHDGHTAVAAYLQETQGVDGWWAQSITVGYERITGLRLPFQRPDGTFTANKSRTVSVDREALRAILLDDVQRHDLFPGRSTALRSKPTSKVIRLAIGPGVAQLAFDPKADGRTKITVDHEKLPLFDDVAEWKFYWDEWLDAIDES